VVEWIVGGRYGRAGLFRISTGYMLIIVVCFRGEADIAFCIANPLMTQSRHELVHRTCPLSGVMRTCRFALSANDPWQAKRAAAVLSKKYLLTTTDVPPDDGVIPRR
jgi:hypothetical protein